MNEENEWDHRIPAEVREGPTDCIRISEVAAALKKKKNSSFVRVNSRNDGTQWLLDLCNGIVKEGCIPEYWKSSVILPIYKGKGDSMECGSYRGINCWNII